MKKKLLILLMVFVAVFTITACGNKAADKTEEKKTEETTPAKDGEKKEDAKKDDKKDGGTLNLFAAASLEKSFKEIIPLYKEKEGVDISINLEGSGTLQKQIEEGAAADVFISAGQKQIKALAEKKLLTDGSKVDLLKNDLVIVVPKGKKSNIKSYKDLEKANGKIAIAETDTVPAGQYTKASLTKLGIFDKIQKNVVYAKNVKATLTYVENGEAAAGFVYKSDAVTSDKVEIVDTMPADSHDPIIYPAAVIKASKKQDQAKKFLEFLKSDECKKIFEKAGFKID